MEYILDGHIIFNVEDNTLINKYCPEQRVDITLTASRLLLLLIRHQGEVLVRDAIMKAVWEDFGLNASSSSLNQYVSVLRGVFRSLEISANAIETVPRIGFMMSSEMKIQIMHTPEECAAADNCFDGSVLSIPERNTIPAQPTARYQRGIPIMVLMLLVLVFLLYVNISLKNQAPYSLTFKYSGHYQKCRVLTLPMYKHDNNPPSQAVLFALIRTSGFTCLPGGEFYLHIDGNVMHGMKGKAWVSYCERKKDDGTIECRDYLSNDWEVPQ